MKRIFLKTLLVDYLDFFPRTFFPKFELLNSECSFSASAAYQSMFTVGNMGTFRRITVGMRPIWEINSLTLHLLSIEQNFIEKLCLTDSYYRTCNFLWSNLLIKKRTTLRRGSNFGVPLGTTTWRPKKSARRTTDFATNSIRFHIGNLQSSFLTCKHNLKV